MKRQRSNSKPKKYKPNKSREISKKIILCVWILSLISAGWFTYFETADTALVGMLRVLYPLVMIPVLFSPFDKKTDSLKVLQSSFSEDGIINTLISWALTLGLVLGLMFFSILGFSRFIKFLMEIL
ncbi:hypothetical protein OAZ93_02545 [Prochlorococcus sp. AH-736-F09]|nr:hypothetical protein [Prochlorococcus sp. AH-736-F09]